MIKKRYILIPLVGLIGIVIIIVIAGAIGYLLLSRHAGDTEMVFAATEVGTPVGDKVTKAIGPEGGSITSPDGRLTLTVPENALTETVPFSIQPVTNKFEAGLGLSYRLEPEGKTFATPLDISVHYDDHDLEGTFPEALSLAYQDKDGAWHMQNAIDLDEDKKTITVSATHFSVFELIYREKLLPAKATLHVGERLKILATNCNPVNRIIDFLLGGKCSEGWGMYDNWKLVGEGKLAQDYPYMIYTAPGKKPTPNVATVIFYQPEFMVSVEVPCPLDKTDGWRIVRDRAVPWPNVRQKCHKMVPGPGTLESVITIIDRGYKATGSDGPTTYSGTVCSLDKEFTVVGHSGPLALTFKFKPSGDGRAGTGSLDGSVSVATWTGNGPYTIEGFDSEKPKIVWVTDQTVSGKISGRGTFHIDLVPLDGDECSGQ